MQLGDLYLVCLPGLCSLLRSCGEMEKGVGIKMRWDRSPPLSPLEYIIAVSR